MNDEETKKPLTFFFAFSLGIAILSGLSRYFFLGMDSLVPSALVVMASLCLGLSLDMKRRDMAYLPSLLLVFAGLLYLSAELLEIYTPSVPFKEIVIAAVGQSYTLLLFLPLFLKCGWKKWLVMLLSFVSVIGFFFLNRHYVISYCYLYREMGNLMMYEKVLKVLFLIAVLSLCGELLLKGERIYLSYLLMAILMIGSAYAGIYQTESSFSLSTFGRVFLVDYSPIWNFLILIIYIGMDKPRTLDYERRNVVFSNMVYEELKPVKRKKKVKPLETPPNVPGRKNYEEEYPGYIR